MLTLVNKGSHGFIFFNMWLTCVNVCQHVLTFVTKRSHASTCVNMCSQGLTCVNMR